MRKRGRTDANQSAIVDRFREWGWLVMSLSNVGNGCPDLLVAAPNGTKLLLVEVKADKGKLTPAQERWHLLWPRITQIVRTVDDVDNLALNVGK